MAALTGLNATTARASMPVQILNAHDVSLYSRALSLVSTGKSDDAKPLLAQVQDATLVGTVEAQGFSAMVPQASVSQWLAKNADLPAAAKIADQARRRGETVAVATPWHDTLPEVAAESASKTAVGSQDLWQSGLAAWKRKDYDDAQLIFSRLADAPLAPPSLAAAGAYWGSRAALRAGHPEQSSPLLDRAADYPRTFYGVLARRALGLPVRAQWENDSLTRPEMTALATMPGGKRAMALIQIGRADLAEPELRGIYADAKPEQRAAILRLATAAGMSALAGRLARADADADGDDIAAAFDDVRYPIPQFAPAAGWQIDRALVYAFMRQESGFNPKATSGAGARGLMQVMPATAAVLTGDKSFLKKKGKSRKLMLTPEVSLDLGQRYLARLFAQPDISGNLIQAAVAYQAGPGNLAHWRTAMGPDVVNDPLLFLESLPSHTSRQYAERVIVNLWIYRSRLGLTNTTLDSVTAGGWPRYAQLDPAADFATLTAIK